MEMTKLKCKICGFEMEKWKNKKWICTNPDCSGIILIDIKPWYIQLSDDSSLWNDEILKKSPAIIAYEYNNLYKMLKKGEVSGIILKLKDNFEVIIKFSIMIILSDTFTDYSKKTLYKDVIYHLTRKLPSLGDWYNASQKIIKIGKIENANLKNILLDVNDIYKTHNIVNWRNVNIGHGAFSSVENEHFQNDLIDKIKILSNHFNRCSKDYTEMKFLLKYGKREFIPLVGYESLNNIKYSDCDLYFFSTLGKRKPLIPLIRNIDKGIFFFDSYIAQKKKTTYLNYIDGRKFSEINESINHLYKSVMKSINLIQTEGSAEEKIHSKRSEEAIEKILEPNVLIPFDFLRDKLEKNILDSKSGIHLLEMKNGMGKTTFVKMIDGLSYKNVKNSISPKAISKILLSDAIMCCAFYVNSVYSHSKLSFVQNITDTLRITENGDKLVGDIPTVDTNSPEAKAHMAALINDLFEAQKRNTATIDRLLFVIDGIDELPNTGNNSIFDLIPDKGQLNEGIHLLITCRTPDQTSEYTKSLLNKVNFDTSITINDDNEEYHSVLKNFVSDKIKSDDATTVEKIISMSDGKMLNLENVICAYLQIGQSIFEKVDGGIFNILFKLYGGHYYDEIFHLAAVIVAVPLPINIYDIAYLAGEEAVTFKIITYIGELKPILDIRHTSNGTLISITRPEVRDLVRSSEDVCKKIYSDWIEDLNEFVKENTSITETDSRLFLLKFLSICFVANEQRDIFVKSKIFPQCCKIVAMNIKSKNEWDYLLMNKLFSLLCCDIAPILSDFKDSKNFESIILIVENLSTTIQIYGGNVAENIKNLETVFKLIDEKNFDPTIKLNLTSKIGSMLAEIDKIDESEKYFEYAEKIREDIEKNSNTIKSSKKSALDKTKSNDTGKDTKNVANKISMIKDYFNQVVAAKNDLAYNKAVDYLTKAENLINSLDGSGYEKTKNFALLKNSILKTFGNIYKRSEPEKALRYLLDARKVLDSIKDEDVTFKGAKYDLLLNTGQVYRVLKDYEKAAQLYDEGIELIHSMQINGELYEAEYLVSFYLSRGNIEKDLENYKESIKFYSKALEIADKELKEGRHINSTMYASVKVSLAKAQEKLNDDEEAHNLLDSINIDDINFNRTIHSRPSYVTEDKTIDDDIFDDDEYNNILNDILNDDEYNDILDDDEYNNDEYSNDEHNDDGGSDNNEYEDKIAAEPSTSEVKNDVNDNHKNPRAEESFKTGMQYVKSREYEKAIKYFEDAADDNHIEALYNLGFMYHNGYGVTKDEKKALKFLKKAGYAGNVDAASYLGAIFSSKKDYKQSMKWLLKAAELGDVDSMKFVMMMYNSGVGVKKNIKEAFKWLLKAAESGDVECMHDLAATYYNGFMKVDVDVKKSIEWYKKAAKKGYALSMFNLGWIYHEGFHNQHNYAEAMKWYLKAAEAGNSDAMNNIGQMYRYGDGVKKDYEVAFDWYKKAAELGNDKAIRNLDELCVEFF